MEEIDIGLRCFGDEWPKMLMFVRGRVDGKICTTSLLFERCLIGVTKRGRSDAPEIWENTRGRRGKGESTTTNKSKDTVRCSGDRERGEDCISPRGIEQRR